MDETTMTADATSAPSDPFRTVADAMSQAAQAARDGAADAKAHIDELMPAVGGSLSRLTYNASYAVSYGVVFPALLLARAIPKENALVHGLADGALAARDALLNRQPGEALAGTSAGAALEPA